MAREIDDIKKRKEYRAERFDDKKSTIDEYTGERIFYGNTRDALKKHPTGKTTDDDHITPIDVIEKRYSRLTKDQQKKLANEDVNLALTNSRLNRSKGKLENHEYLIRQIKNGTPENITTTTTMLKKEIIARTSQRIEATGMMIQNDISDSKAFITECTNTFLDEDAARINAEGIDAAVDAAIFSATVAVVRNTASVVKGDLSMKDAIKDTVVSVGASATMAYATRGVMETLNLDRGEAGLIIAETVEVSKQVFLFFEGKIDEEQLLENVAETTACVAAAYMGRVLGKMVGDMIVPGVGGMVGQYVGEMLTTAICSEIVSTIKEYNAFDKNNKRIINLYHKAESEIKESQERLKQIINEKNNEILDEIKEGFHLINVGIEQGSYDSIEAGLICVGKTFDMSEEYLRKDLVTKDNLFSGSEEPIIIG